MDPKVKICTQHTEGGLTRDTKMVNDRPLVCLISATPCLEQWLAHRGCPVNICRKKFLLCKFKRKAKRKQCVCGGGLPRNSGNRHQPRHLGSLVGESGPVLSRYVWLPQWNSLDPVSLKVQILLHPSEEENVLPLTQSRQAGAWARALPGGLGLDAEGPEKWGGSFPFRASHSGDHRTSGCGLRSSKWLSCLQPPGWTVLGNPTL